MQDRVGLCYRLAEWLKDQGYFRNCLNCAEWKEKEEICGKFNARPPAKIIVKGCDNHSDLIPF